MSHDLSLTGIETTSLHLTADSHIRADTSRRTATKWHVKMLFGPKVSYVEVMDRSPFTTLPAEDFVYTPLPAKDFIRVLTIRPSRCLNDPLSAIIEAVPMTENARYEALSYSWGMDADGDATLNRMLLIDGKTKHITQNLYEGLLRLRQEAWPKNRRLWVDAICINQADTDEQSHQVFRMGLVYRNASKTLVWLGEGEDPRENLDAHAFLSCSWAHYTVGDRCRDHVRYGNDELSRPVRKHKLYMHLSRSERKVSNWLRRRDLASSATKLFSKRYFKRRWIVQELCNSNRRTTQMYWGAFTCLLEDLWNSRYELETIYALSFKQTHASRSGIKANLENMAAFGTFYSVVRETGSDSGPRGLNNFIALVLSCRMDCSDLRDLSYSLLSIAPVLGIVPDYSFSTAMVFTQLARKLIENGALSFVLLNSCGSQEPCRIQGLPTWVPDLGHMRGEVRSFEPETVPYFKYDYFKDMDASFSDDVTLNIAPYDCGIIRTAASSNHLRRVDLSLYLSETPLETGESSTDTPPGDNLVNPPNRSEPTDSRRRIRNSDGSRMLWHAAGKNRHRVIVMPGDYCFDLTGFPLKSKLLLIMRRVNEERDIFRLVTEVQIDDIQMPEWMDSFGTLESRRVRIQVK